MKTVSVLCIVILVCIAVIFAAYCIKEATPKTFRGDEVHGFRDARVLSYSHHLFKGMARQRSPAPLYYIILRFLIQIREPVGSFGLPFNIYYRLDTILYTLISGLGVMMLFYFRIRKTAKSLPIYAIQAFFLIIALLAYYFLPSRYTFNFSIETRPYSLWNALWFVVLALILFRNKLKTSFIFLLVLLAATSSGSIYQLCALLYSFIIIELLSKKKISETFKTALKVFALPIFVCLYYIVARNPHAAFFNPWDRFFYFWISKEKILLLSLAGILLTYPLKNFRGHTIVFSTMLVLYAIAPSINYISILRGLGFSSWHYCYYELIYPLFFISMALIIPSYAEKIKGWLKSNARHAHI